MEITEENIEELIATYDEPDVLKELMVAALQFEREDLVEAILEKSIHINQLLDKLREFDLSI